VFPAQPFGPLPGVPGYQGDTSFFKNPLLEIRTWFRSGKTYRIIDDDTADADGGPSASEACSEFAGVRLEAEKAGLVLWLSVRGCTD
jgi:hypothetical protein